MSTQVMAAPVSLDVRMLLPMQQQQQRSSRPRIVPSPVCVSRVRRCLFGLPSDPQQAIEQAAQELERQAHIDSQRWNFDFASETPLPGGQYVWKNAAATHDDQANGNSISSSSTDNNNSRMRQSQITEFLQSRKRTSSGTLTAANSSKRPCIRSTTTTTPADATTSSRT